MTSQPATKLQERQKNVPPYSGKKLRSDVAHFPIAASRAALKSRIP